MDIEVYLPLLEKMLNEKWLHTTSIVVDEGKKEYLQRVYLIKKDNQKLDLFPLLQSMSYNDKSQENRFYFLNDLKNFEQQNGEICLLNYPDAKLLKDNLQHVEFLKVINIYEWKKHKLKSEFQQRINELSESFKGRIEEKRKIYEFIDNNNEGLFILSGNPGVGKSAVFAKIVEELRSKASLETRDVYVVEYFIRRNTQGNSAKRLLEYLHKKLDKIYDTNIEYLGDLDKDQSNLHEKLKIISKSLNKKIVILIDGIDEGVTKDNHNILNYLITENYPNILVLYSDRWTVDIEKFYLKLPIEYKTLMKLEGLKINDIRGMLYEVANKYELDKDSVYIKEVLKRSEGNPLYVKLLSLDFEKLGYNVSSHPWQLIYKNIGMILFQKNKLKEAVKYMDKALQCINKPANTILAINHFTNIQRAFYIGKKDVLGNAIEEFKLWLKAEPNIQKYFADVLSGEPVEIYEKLYKKFTFTYI